jgi:hypothetical protein
MIEFKLSDNKQIVFVKVDPQTADRHYPLEINCNDPVYASLLIQRLRKVFGDTVSMIREEEYLKGYKDGRAKRGKKGWFSTLFKQGQA